MLKQPLQRLNVINTYLRGLRRYFLFTIFFSIVATALGTVSPQLIRITVDSIIGDEVLTLPSVFSRLAAVVTGNTLGFNLILMSALVIVTAVLSGLATFTSKTFAAKTSESFIKRLKDALYLHVQRLPMSFHVGHQTGDIIQRCTSDTEVIRNFISEQLLEVFRTLFLIIFSVSIMFSMNIKLSIIALCFTPIIVFYSGIFYNLIAKNFKVADEAEGELSSAVQENLSGVRVVRAFGRQKYELEKFDNKNNHFAKLWIKLGTISGVYWSVGDLITGLQILTVMLVGVFEATSGNLTVGEFISFLTYNQSLIWPLRSLGRIVSEMSKAGVSLDRVHYILHQPEETDEPNAKEPTKLESITFDNVSFSYAGGEQVLKNVSFTIRAGETFAVLGLTGSGKSTLAALLTRLYDLPPDSGRITVNGIDINNIKIEWLRKNIALVLQEPFLFSRTIEENIKAAAPSSELPHVREVADTACIDESIMGFAKGYDTMVGEKGVTLSGGQKQRVAIARMLLTGAPAMIFDDSLSAVDSQTDYKIRAALKSKLEEATVIIISHRITTLMQADKIMVLVGGEVVDIGTHEQLSGRDGVYKEIHDIQLHKDAPSGGDA